MNQHKSVMLLLLVLGIALAIPMQKGPDAEQKAKSMFVGVDVDVLGPRCGCVTCTDEVLNTDAGGYSCRSRMDWLQGYGGGHKTEDEACKLVAGLEFKDDCGACDPDTCNDVIAVIPPPVVAPSEVPPPATDAPTPPPPTKEPTPKATKEPTPKATNAPTPKVTKEPTPKATEAPTPKDTAAPAPAPAPDAPAAVGPTSCGCASCGEAQMAADAGGHACGDRIAWFQNEKKYSEEDACRQVAGKEFPAQCGACDPNTCTAAAAPAPPPATSQSGASPPAPPASAPAQHPHHSKSKCGGAVSSGDDKMCKNYLWDPAGDNDMACMAYGGKNDPCHLSNNNDPNHGLDKDPSKCLSDTLYLWDEPDTQGKSYSWAGKEWKKYAAKYATQLRKMRNAGTKVTSPLIKAGGSGFIKKNLDKFLDSCGSGCTDPTSPAYIDIIGVNAFCGPWNKKCEDGVNFIVGEVEKASKPHGNMPVYITNWSYLQTSKVSNQLKAMTAAGTFFKSGSPVSRVYWFGARDYGGNSENNYLHTKLTDGSGKTLGDKWKELCKGY